jgi:molybdenum cofactor cytidylyltransferase
MAKAGRGAALEVVILAAGESKRFNGIKVLAAYGDKPVLQRAIDNALVLTDVAVTVVVGAHRSQIVQQIDFSGVKRLYNARWQDGMASSLRCAVRCADDDTQAMLFVAADQVLVRPDHLAAMAKHWRENPDRIVAAFYGSEPGIPALIPRRFWSGLTALTGDSGAKKIINANKLNLILYNLPEAEKDIDTREDLETLTALRCSP